MFARMFKPVSVAVAALALSACATQAKQELASVGSGQYVLEKPHASILWRIKHMGLSNYTGRLTDFDISLNFDPAKPEASTVKAVINPMAVRAEHPSDTGWDRKIGEEFFKGLEFPQIVFTSTQVVRTGENTGKVTGDLTFRGVTKPVVLDVTWNGTARSPFYGSRDLLGFSARGVFKRSDFGLTAYSFAASDEVEIIIETEFVQATNLS